MKQLDKFINAREMEVKAGNLLLAPTVSNEYCVDFNNTHNSKRKTQLLNRVNSAIGNSKFLK